MYFVSTKLVPPGDNFFFRYEDPPHFHFINGNTREFTVAYKKWDHQEIIKILYKIRFVLDGFHFLGCRNVLILMVFSENSSCHGSVDATCYESYPIAWLLLNIHSRPDVILRLMHVISHSYLFCFCRLEQMSLDLLEFSNHWRKWDNMMESRDFTST